MKHKVETNVAVVDTSAILKFLQINDKNKDISVQRVWHTIEDLSKMYTMVIIPKTAIDELNDATEQTKHQILRDSLSRSNIIVRHYSSDDIFVFAKNAAIEFNCPVEIITCDAHVGTQIRCAVEVF